MEVEARRVLVRGRVQGVSFRWATRAEALRLGLGGWVRNLADGRVEAFAEGGRDGLAALLAFLETGPPGARVDDLRVEVSVPVGASGFEIRPTVPA